MYVEGRDHLTVCAKGTPHTLNSISMIFKSAAWLERELSEFSGVVFCGLLDTRRLLLDYTEPKRLTLSHVSNDKNFDSMFYEVGYSI
jgi:NADH:ubiquinone oxidoreductase subunit C